MRITGLSGFLDVESLVQQLMAIERRPLLRLEQQRAGLESRRATWEQVRGQLRTLKDALSALTDGATFSARTASSSDTSIATATASAGASEGTYTLVVDNLARAHRVASKRFADPDADLGLAGTPVINGKAVNITADMSLREIAAAIHGAGAGVRASVVDGTLVIEAEQTGAANAITVTDDGGVLLGLEVIDGTGAWAHQLQAAEDAAFRVNGLAVTRSSNTVSDVVAGVTFQLRAESSQEVTITVALAKDEIRAKAQRFVDAYNALYRRLNELTAKGGALQGDGTALRLRDALRRVVDDRVPNGAVDRLEAVGIRVEGGLDVDSAGQGLLTLDAAAFDAALEDDPDAVRRLFAARTAVDGFAGVAVRLRAEASRYADAGGVLEGLLEGVADRIDDLADRIARMETRLMTKEQQLYREFSRLEQALSQLSAQGAWLSGMLGTLPGSGGRSAS